RLARTTALMRGRRDQSLPGGRRGAKQTGEAFDAEDAMRRRIGQSTLSLVVGIAGSAAACSGGGSGPGDWAPGVSQKDPVTTNVSPDFATDPGPRGGAAGAGGPFSGLGATEQGIFNQALARFQEVDSVSGTVPGEDGSGLGPTFNGNSCSMCHG